MSPDRVPPAAVIDHLAALTDDRGIFEHARGLEPDPSHGYTADDAARALIVVIRWAEPDVVTARLTRTYLDFLADATDDDGRLRNRLTADGRWVGPWSADAHGRAIWGLAVAAGGSPDSETARRSLSILKRLAPLSDTSLRPWIYAGLGAAALVPRSEDGPTGSPPRPSTLCHPPRGEHGLGPSRASPMTTGGSRRCTSPWEGRWDGPIS